MGKFTRGEFSRLCGISENAVRTYVGRGKIFIGDDGLIDNTMIVNAGFYAKRIAAQKEKQALPVQPVQDAQQVSAPKSTTNKVKEQPKLTKKEINKIQAKEDKRAEDAVVAWNLDRQIKEAELEAKEQMIELNKLKIAKIRGDVIPTDLVNVVFSQHFKSITTAFHQGADNFISEISKISGLSREDMARIRGELIDIVNLAVADGVKMSIESVDAIVNEYSQKRGVGESK